MAKIKAGTYRFNDVLINPATNIESNVNFAVNTDVAGVGSIEAICTNIKVEATIAFTSPNLKYYILSTAPNIGLPSEGSYSTVYFAEGDEWTETLGGSSLQTITIPYDQDVSDEFEPWFTANTKREGAEPAATITYNGETIATLNGGQSATLKCKGKKMESDVVVDVAEVSAQLDAELDEQETLILELKESLEKFQSYGKNYIVFSNSDGLSLHSYGNKKHWNGDIEYSTDAINWSVWDGTTTLSAEDGKLYLRGTGNTCITGSSDSGSGSGWILSGSNIFCSGNIENLLDYATVANGDHPAMDDYCYLSMFYNCTSLVSAPELPATTLTYECYAAMFWGCTSLVSAPELPATTLAVSCYRSMFRNCTSLVSAPKIHAITLADGCCIAMFVGCTSLVSAPELPATTLAESCYEFMFEDCTSLVYAPELPATTLAHRCYCAMFRRCTDLTTLPTLPATALTTVCYASMFEGCTAIKLSESQTGDYKTAYRIPNSGTGNDSTASLKQMFDNTGGTFTGTPSINTVYYTSNVVVNSSDQKDLNKKRLQKNNLDLAECLELASELPSGGASGGTDERFKQLVEKTIAEVSDDTVTSVGSDVFKSCSQLTSVNLPLATSVGSGAFNSCYQLTSINLPSVTSIGTNAFSSCSKLTSVNVPNVTSVGSNSFSYCSELKSIDLPLVTSAGNNVFYNCSKLSCVIFRAETVCTLANTNVFNSTPFASGKAGGTLIVPRSLVENYKTATNWSFIWGYGHNRFIALEDYTVDGTITGEIDWDKLNGGAA